MKNLNCEIANRVGHQPLLCLFYNIFFIDVPVYIRFNKNEINYLAKMCFHLFEISKLKTKKFCAPHCTHCTRYICTRNRVMVNFLHSKYRLFSLRRNIKKIYEN